MFLFTIGSFGANPSCLTQLFLLVLRMRTRRCTNPEQVHQPLLASPGSAPTVASVLSKQPCETLNVSLDHDLASAIQ